MIQFQKVAKIRTLHRPPNGNHFMQQHEPSSTSALSSVKVDIQFGSFWKVERPQSCSDDPATLASTTISEYIYSIQHPQPQQSQPQPQLSTTLAASTTTATSSNPNNFFVWTSILRHHFQQQSIDMTETPIPLLAQFIGRALLSWNPTTSPTISMSSSSLELSPSSSSHCVAMNDHDDDAVHDPKYSCIQLSYSDENHNHPTVTHVPFIGCHVPHHHQKQLCFPHDSNPTSTPTHTTTITASSHHNITSYFDYTMVPSIVARRMKLQHRTQPFQQRQVPSSTLSSTMASPMTATTANTNAIAENQEHDAQERETLLLVWNRLLDLYRTWKKEPYNVVTQDVVVDDHDAIRLEQQPSIKNHPTNDTSRNDTTSRNENNTNLANTNTTILDPATAVPINTQVECSTSTSNNSNKDDDNASTKEHHNTVEVSGSVLPSSDVTTSTNTTTTKRRKIIKSSNKNNHQLRTSKTTGTSGNKFR
jgi:hypothetical protein